MSIVISAFIHPPPFSIYFYHQGTLHFAFLFYNYIQSFIISFKPPSTHPPPPKKKKQPTKQNTTTTKTTTKNQKPKTKQNTHKKQKNKTKQKQNTKKTRTTKTEKETKNKQKTASHLFVYCLIQYNISCAVRTIFRSEYNFDNKKDLKLSLQR